MQPVQYLTWLIQHHAEIVADILAVLIALTAVVHGMHGVVLALGMLAKLTPTKADDDALSAADAWLDKAERGLVWMQAHLPHVGINRARAALLERDGSTAQQRRSTEPSGVGPVPIDPADRDTVPGKPKRPVKPG